MSAATRAIAPVLRDTVRSRWLPALGLSLALAAELLLRFGGGGTATLASLMEVLLVMVPLVALVAATEQMGQARDLLGLLLAQPVTRRRVFAQVYIAAVLPLLVVVTIGVGLPFALHGMLVGGTLRSVLRLIGATGALALIGAALGMTIALRVEQRLRALGFALGAWLAATLLWDGVVLFAAMLSKGHPIEVPMLVLLALNPVDLVRVLLLIGTDGAALSGYTGAVVQHAFGAGASHWLLLAALGCWLILPLWGAARTFQRKDF